MTREEALDILHHNWTRIDNPNYKEEELDEAFFMAIEALNNQPVLCKDCKRQFTNKCYMIYGKHTMRNLFNNDYCSYGERREP